MVIGAPAGTAVQNNTYPSAVYLDTDAHYTAGIIPNRTGNINSAEDFFEEVGRASFTEKEYDAFGREMMSEVQRQMYISMIENETKREAERQTKVIEEGLPMPANAALRAEEISPVSVDEDV